MTSAQKALAVPNSDVHACEVWEDKMDRLGPFASITEFEALLDEMPRHLVGTRQFLSGFIAGRLAGEAAR